MPETRLWLITPVHNEAAHLGEVIGAVAAQTRLPDRWTIVDDGSDDGSAGILREAAAELPFARVVATPERFTAPSPDRLAAAAPDRVFNFGLRSGDLSRYTHVGKLDGDIVLPPDWVDFLLARFADDPRLGIASGSLDEFERGRWRHVRTPPELVAGQSRIYARECFEAIGGMPERLGADAITTTYARMRGFNTRTYPELRARHMRRMGSAQGSLRGRRRHGLYQYIVHYPLWWIAARALMVGVRFSPRGLSGAAFLAGWLEAAVRRVARVDDPAFGAFMRADLRRRAGGAVRRRLKGV